MDVYIWILSLCLSFTLIQTQNCKNEQKCRVSRIHGMKGADCYKKDMRTFPQCISSDIEIIDLSFNRIRKLTKDDLKKYSYLKMLYLSDNVIVSIDEATFQGKDDLNTLDLSLNALSKLPPVVFHLPSLKTLYLGQNLNMNIVDAIEKAKPVTSPLIQLDISYVMVDEPDTLPDFGILPFLTKYNISGNKLLNLTTKYFAGLCSLKILDSSNVSNEFIKPCDCWTINKWLKSRKVKFTPFECEINEMDCLDEVPPDDQQTYIKCSEKLETINKHAKWMKYLIPIAIIAAICLLGIGFVVFKRRQKKKQTRKLEEAEQQMLYNHIQKT